MKIIITGSEGLLGKEISKFLEKDNTIIKSDLLFVSLDSIVYHKIDNFPRVSEYVSMFRIVPTLPIFLKVL